jgi:hypothetical protein
MVSYHLPCDWGTSHPYPSTSQPPSTPPPLDSGRRLHQVPKDSLIRRGDSSSWWVGVRVSDAQQNPVRHRNQRGEGSTAHQTGKNPGSSSDLPQEAEGKPDHLPMGHPSNCHFWGETMSLTFREWYGSTVLNESV